MSLENRILFEELLLQRQWLPTFLRHVDELKKKTKGVAFMGLLPFLRLYCDGYVDWNLSASDGRALERKWDAKLKTVSEMLESHSAVILELGAGDEWFFQGRPSGIDDMADWLSIYALCGRIICVSLEIDDGSVDGYQFHNGKYRHLTLQPFWKWKRSHWKIVAAREGRRTARRVRSKREA